MLRNEIALIKKPGFHFLKAAISGPVSNQNDSSYSYHSATVNKERKADNFEKSSSHGCRKTHNVVLFICRLIESEHNSIRNGGILCRK